MDPKNDPSKTDPTPDPEPTPEPDPTPDPEPNDPEPLDKNGNPGINREKYQRDIEARDAKIAELQAKLDEAAKTEEGRAELQKQLDEFKAEADSAKTDLALERAGCTDPKKAAAAKALLSGYDGVAALKADHPYLFEDKKQTGSTGGKPGGAPSTSDERRAKAREAASGGLVIKR